MGWNPKARLTLGSPALALQNNTSLRLTSTPTFLEASLVEEMFQKEAHQLDQTTVLFPTSKLNHKKCQKQQTDHLGQLR
jgi:hypothetical protein